MKITDIVDEIKTKIPQSTDYFTNRLVETTIEFNGGVGRVIINNHGLNTGDRVTLSSFIVDGDLINAEHVNTRHNINIVDLNEFEIDIGISGFTQDITDIKVHFNIRVGAVVNLDVVAKNFTQDSKIELYVVDEGMNANKSRDNNIDSLTSTHRYAEYYQIFINEVGVYALIPRFFSENNEKRTNTARDIQKLLMLSIVGSDYGVSNTQSTALSSQQTVDVNNVFYVIRYGLEINEIVQGLDVSQINKDIEASFNIESDIIIDN